MDNLNHPKKVTIKINGRVKSFEDGNLVDEKPEAAAVEPDESFDWILPEDDEGETEDFIKKNNFKELV